MSNGESLGAGLAGVGDVAGVAGVASLVEQKPGWLTRLFEIEVGTLIACDAEQEEGTWVSKEPFRFLYRGRRGHYFLLTDRQSWRVLERTAADQLFGELPVKLVARPEDPPGAGATPVDAGEDENGGYRVVRNDDWYFSIFPDHTDLPPGWLEAGFQGTKRQCLEHIEANCVFGAPNPGMK